MSDSGKTGQPEYIDVVPVNGKYCEFVFEGKTYKIWRVHPGTPDKFGTPVPYQVAISYLAKSTPIISVVPTIKNGALVSPVLEADRERIKQATALGISYRNYNVPGASAGGDAEALQKALSSVVDQQRDNAKLQAALAESTRIQGELAKRLEALEKQGAAGSTGGSGTSL